MKTEVSKCLRIYCPKWFERKDFQTWLNSPRTATWHVKGTTPCDLSDAFTNFDNGDGFDMPWPDEPTLPHDIWDAICHLCKEKDFTHGLIQFINVEGE